MDLEIIKEKSSLRDDSETRDWYDNSEENRDRLMVRENPLENPTSINLAWRAQVEISKRLRRLIFLPGERHKKITRRNVSRTILR